YQSLLSMLIAAVFGKGVFYYLTIASILFVLSLSANTAFADFPRLCRAIAQNNYLPHVFGYRGRRLVYTYGIVVLALLSCFLLVIFGGVTDRLIQIGRASCRERVETSLLHGLLKDRSNDHVRSDE